jgi:hypothetical protein
MASEQVFEAVAGQDRLTPKEHIPIRFDETYHGASIRIIEFDHQDSNLDNQHFRMPTNWREIIKNEFEVVKQGAIALEYCMPDIWRRAYSEITGFLINDQTWDAGSFGFSGLYGYLTRLTGQEGKTILAIDPQNSVTFDLFQLGASKFVNVANTLVSLGNYRATHYDYGHLSESEIRYPLSPDARHLLPARALMEETMRTPHAKHEDYPDIALFTAPTHAMKTSDYIKRQLAYETSNSPPQNPEDFSKHTPKEERWKMRTYGLPPIDGFVREYSPILSTDCFALDLQLHDGEMAADPTKRDSMEYLRYAQKQIAHLLEREPTSSEVPYFKRLRQSLAILQKITQDGIINKAISINSSLCHDLRGSLLQHLSTDHYGWKLTAKRKIY